MEKEFRSKIFDEINLYSMQGICTVTQIKEYKLNKEGAYTKYISGSVRYAHESDPMISKKNSVAFLRKNPNCNTLAIKLDRIVVIDFDSMESYEDLLSSNVIEPYMQSTTKINKTPRGVHYLYKMPSSWIGRFTKTVHILNKAIDVIFGENALEHVYPSYVKHPILGYMHYTKINQNTPQDMPESLRLFLEPHLNIKQKVHIQEKNRNIKSIENLSILEERICVELVKFGYADVQLIRKIDHGDHTGYDFTYDHSKPDPLDVSVIHDHIDGYVIVQPNENSIYVGTYSKRQMKRHSAFLCNIDPLEELDECLLHSYNAKELSYYPSITYNERYVLPYQDNYNLNPIKFTLVESDMGTGKSHQVRAHIDKWKPDSVLILTPRILFGRSIIDTLNVGRDNDAKFAIYLDLPSGKIIAPYVICSIESMWRLNREYSHIYIDEIESCLSIFSSETIVRKKIQCVEMFSTLLNKAQRVVFCDAHLSERTVNFLCNTKVPKDQVLIEHNTYKPNRREAIEIPYWSKGFGPGEKLLYHMIDKLKQGYNIVMASASKAFLIKLEQLLPGILKNEEYIIYTADTDEEDKMALRQVEQIWKTKRLVAYSTTISVGVDFNIEHFDLLYVYANNYHCGPARDIIQSMHRVRKLRLNIMYYTMGESPEPNCYNFNNRNEVIKYLSSIAEFASVAYGNLTSKDIVEAKAPYWLYELHIHNLLEISQSKNNYRYSFQALLNHSGYVKKKEYKKLAAFDPEIDNLKKNEKKIKYCEIPYINHPSYNELKDKVYEKTATTLEKLQVLKFEFNSLGYDMEENWKNWLDAKNRNFFRRVSLERKADLVEDILKEADYSDLVRTEALLVRTMQNITNSIKLKNSIDKSYFNPTNIDIGKLSEAELIIHAQHEDSLRNRICNVFQHYNGGMLEPSQKYIRVNGKPTPHWSCYPLVNDETINLEINLLE